MFKVIVSQGAAFSRMSTTLTMDITILGQNDHRPAMSQEFYNFFLAYKEPNHFVIDTVSATDADQRK
jgi:hypothetical protein